MAPQQARYREVAEKVKALRSALAQRTAGLMRPDMTDQEWEAATDQIEAVRRELGLDAAEAELAKAERDLLVWLKAQVQERPEYRQHPEIEELFEPRPLALLFRARLLDIALRFSA